MTKPLKFLVYSVSNRKKNVSHKLLLHSSPHEINFPSKTSESDGETGQSSILVKVVKVVKIQIF